VTRGNEESWPPASIVLGDDTSLEATEAGELAASIGRLFGAEGHVVHAYPTLPRISEDEDAFDARIVEEAFRQAEKALEERGDALESSLGRPLEVKAAVGDAAALILGVAREVKSPALIAVGSRGLGAGERARRGFSRLGSVSTKIVRAARGPVLVCPRH
jgi:nucleotide-binding universal stress UspA family protein